MAKKVKPAEEVEASVNMSPMIDCCFLLLIFFVVNATQITVSKDPCIGMPSAVSCSELKDANGCIVVNVFADSAEMPETTREKFFKAYSEGTLWGVSDNAKSVGYTAAQTQDLTDFIDRQKKALKAKNMEDAQIRLYLRGDINAPWERTATAIRCASAAGVSNIVFGTLPTK